MAFTITCPVCGGRNSYEFRFGGEERGPRPEEEGLTPRAWCEYVHMRSNAGGPQKEWWLHRDGCGLWFTICRDTFTNLQVNEPEAKA
jgi:sarcosine oxidase, subunit delta